MSTAATCSPTTPTRPPPGGPEPTAPFDLDGARLTGHLLAEEIHLAGASAVAQFSGGAADGRPALTQSAYGQGIGYYLATVPDAAVAGRITAWLAEAAGVRPVVSGLPPRSKWPGGARCSP